MRDEIENALRDVSARSHSKFTTASPASGISARPATHLITKKSGTTEQPMADGSLETAPRSPGGFPQTGAISMANSRRASHQQRGMVERAGWSVGAASHEGFIRTTVPAHAGGPETDAGAERKPIQSTEAESVSSKSVAVIAVHLVSANAPTRAAARYERPCSVRLRGRHPARLHLRRGANRLVDHAVALGEAKERLQQLGGEVASSVTATGCW